MGIVFSQPKRTKVSLEIIWRSGGEKIDARIAEISASSCFVNCSSEVLSGEIVDFELKCPTGEWLYLQGKIGRVEYPKGFELDFVNLSDESRNALERIVNPGYENLLEYERKVLAEITNADALNLKEEKPQTQNKFQWSNSAISNKTKPDYSAIINKLKPKISGKKKKRVLIADDDQATVKLLKAIVANQGFIPVTAKDGREVYKILQEDNDFVASILDVVMPFIDGMDLVHIMKKDARLKNIPIGIITGEKNSKIWNESLNAGANAFLPKPLNLPQVKMMLTTLVNR